MKKLNLYIDPELHLSLLAIAIGGTLLSVASWALKNPLPSPLDEFANGCVVALVTLVLHPDKRKEPRAPVEPESEVEGE